MAELTYTQAHALLKYDPETGNLFWLERSTEIFPNCVTWNRRYAGKLAFTSKDKDGYCVGTILKKTYKAHRVAWLLHHGQLPSGRIDHKDGDRSCNKIDNLRQVPWPLACRNRSMGTKNTSGIVGVRWDTQTNKWQAYVKIDGRLIQLGKFTDKDAAIAARLEAVRRDGFTSRHGLRAT